MAGTHKKMTIGIDIRALSHGKISGIEEYTLNLLAHLLPLDKNISYKLFYGGRKKVKLNYPWLRHTNVKLYDFNISNKFLFSAAKIGFLKIDKMLGGVDLFFSPHFLPVSLSKNCPYVLTIHDLSFKYFPEFFSFKRKIWHWLVQPRSQAKKANAIIAVSFSTKQDLIDIYQIPSKKIEVIHSGILENFKKISERSPVGREDVSPLEEIRKKYCLPPQFILYLGTIEPRKNIEGIIHAFKLLKKKSKTSKGLKLVIAGQKGWLTKKIYGAAKESFCAKDIIFLGFVDSRDKVYLYNLAEIFVYPSFFEGFGFPALEAMKCGAPTITSHLSSLPEIAGEGAILIDPNNFGDIYLAMKAILEDKKFANALSEKGIEQAKKFSWQECAFRTLEVFKSMV